MKAFPGQNTEQHQNIGSVNSAPFQSLLLLPTILTLTLSFSCTCFMLLEVRSCNMYYFVHYKIHPSCFLQMWFVHFYCDDILLWDYTTCRILNPLSLHPKQITVVRYLLHFPFPTESFLAPFPLPNVTIVSYFPFTLHFSRPLFFLSPSVLNHLFLVPFFFLFFMNRLSPLPSEAKYHDKKENIKYSIHELKNFTNEL